MKKIIKFNLFCLKDLNYVFYYYNSKIKWGLGIGDWGLGPIPNPQSPIPNPQSPFSFID